MPLASVSSVALAGLRLFCPLLSYSGTRGP